MKKVFIAAILIAFVATACSIEEGAENAEAIEATTLPTGGTVSSVTSSELTGIASILTGATYINGTIYAVGVPSDQPTLAYYLFAINPSAGTVKGYPFSEISDSTVKELGSQDKYSVVSGGSDLIIQNVTMLPVDRTTLKVTSEYANGCEERNIVKVGNEFRSYLANTLVTCDSSGTQLTRSTMSDSFYGVVGTDGQSLYHLERGELTVHDLADMSSTSEIVVSPTTYEPGGVAVGGGKIYVLIYSGGTTLLKAYDVE